MVYRVHMNDFCRLIFVDQQYRRTNGRCEDIYYELLSLKLHKHHFTIHYHLELLLLFDMIISVRFLGQLLSR